MTNDIAIIRFGSSQHLVKPGQIVVVDRLKHKEGEEVSLVSLLDKTPVKLKVVSHTLGTKIHGLKFRRKVRYMRRYGHRQQHTLVEVLSIGESKSAPTVLKAGSKAKEAKKTTARAGAKPVAKTPATRSAKPKPVKGAKA